MDEEKRPAGPDGLPAPQRYWAMAAILLGIALSVLDGSIVNLALPDIVRDLGASPAAAVWIVNAYQLATLGLLLPFAHLGDRLGYRRVYLGGLVLFTLASLGCMVAPDLLSLALARAAQGIGAAGMMSVNSALVRLTYPSALLGRGIALNSMTVAISSVAGPSVAAVVLSLGSWHWLFALNIPLGVLLYVLGRRALPHSTAPGGRLPLLDTALNILMFSLLFLGADLLGVRSEAGTQATGAGLLVAALAVGVFYLRRQWHAPAPLFPVDLLRIRIFALSMCTSVTAFSAQMLSFVALPFLLLESQGRGHLEAGLVITAWPLGVVLVAPVAGRLIARVPAGLLGGIGLGLLALGLALVALLPTEASGGALAWRLALCGAGFGLFQSPNNHTIITSAPLSRAGAASGMLGTARLTGQTLGAVLLGAVFATWGVADGTGPRVAIALAGGLAAAAAVFSAARLRVARQ